MARPAPAVRRALHSDPRLLDEPGRGLVRNRRAPGHPPRRVHLSQGPQHQDPRLHRRLERPLPRLRLDQDRRPNPQQGQPSNNFKSAALALLAADRAATRAISTNSLVARGTAAYQVVCALLRADRSDDAEHLSVSMAEKVGREARSDRPTIISVAGALWLISAVIAARGMNRDGAWTRLDRADRLANLLGHDGNYAWTAFGPTNVALHRVSVATEMGDAGEAVRVAADVDTHSLPEGLTSRRAQIHLDLAWAQSQRRRDAEAILHLLEAERTAPEAVRYNVIVRELIRELLTRAGRSKSGALTDLAVRAGVLD